MPLNDTYVQLAADGTGKKVRNISVPVLQADGSVATTYLQVTTLADSEGALLDLDIKGTMEELLMVAKQQRMLLLMLVNAMTNGNLTVDELNPFNEE